MTESKYQARLVKTLRRMFPGCVLIKNDPNYQQGILDWSLFYNDRWAMLEIKASKAASIRPNQEYFVKLLNKMSFAAFIYPENEKEVLDALQQALTPRGRTRISKS